MTANNLLGAIAKKLGSLYPDRKVFDRKIDANADGNHSVRCINQEHAKRLGRRRYRSYSFEILYFQRENDPMVFHDWADTMYMEFETLTAGENSFHVTNAHAEAGDDMVFRFLFDVDFTGLVDPITENQMETLATTEVIKA